jgi:hypothetical protein
MKSSGTGGTARQNGVNAASGGELDKERLGIGLRGTITS